MDSIFFGILPIQRVTALLLGLFLIGSRLLAVGMPAPHPESLIPQLDEILHAAKVSAPTLVEQDYLRKEADERLKQAKSDYYPSLDLRTNFGYEKEFRSGGAENTDNFGLTYSARLTRPLYHWGAIEARIEQARIDNNIQALVYLENTRDIYRRIRSDYLSLILNEASLEVEQSRRISLKKQLDRLKTDFESGKISNLSYSTKALDLQSSLHTISRIERDQKRILETFKKSAGWTQTLEIEDEIPSLDYDELKAWLDTKSVSTAWTENTIDTLITRESIKKHSEQLTLIKAEQRPLFNFISSASQDQSNTSTRNNVDTFSLFAGITVSWNIFDGFQTKHEKIEAKHKQRRLEATLTRQKSDLLSLKQEMRDTIMSQIELTELQEDRYKLEQQSYENSAVESKTGRLSANELNNAELQLGDLWLELMEARAQLLMQISDYRDLTEPTEI